jgi:hypothetical protein
MNYDAAIIATIGDADAPLRHRDLVALLDPEGRDKVAFNNIGMRLTVLYRNGYLTREKSDGRYWYYAIAAERTAIEPGYTWHDAHGPMRVIAIADGYAMCRRPGCIPFVRSIADLRNQKAHADA